jgi:hypothetical protein
MALSIITLLNCLFDDSEEPVDIKLAIYIERRYPRAVPFTNVIDVVDPPHTLLIKALAGPH